MALLLEPRVEVAADDREVEACSLGVDEVLDEILRRVLLTHHCVTYPSQLFSPLRDELISPLYPRAETLRRVDGLTFSWRAQKETA